LERVVGETVPADPCDFQYPPQELLSVFVLEQGADSCLDLPFVLLQPTAA